MSEYSVRVLSITKLTHNVKAYRVERPDGYTFRAGQAADLAIDRPDWDEEFRPFSFTGLASAPELEFIIKSYRDHNGVTAQFDTLKRDAVLLLGDPFGTLEYKGPGLFLAGGTGATPFLAMFRSLVRSNKLAGNRLLWSNVSEHDHFLESEFRQLLGSNFVAVEGRPKTSAIKRLLQPAQDRVYVCGPEAYEAGVMGLVTELGVPENKIERETE